MRPARERRAGQWPQGAPCPIPTLLVVGDEQRRGAVSPGMPRYAATGGNATVASGTVISLSPSTLLTSSSTASTLSVMVSR